MNQKPPTIPMPNTEDAKLAAARVEGAKQERERLKNVIEEMVKDNLAYLDLDDANLALWHSVLLVLEDG